MKVSKKNQLTTKQRMIGLIIVAIVGFGLSAFTGYNIGYDQGTKKNINQSGSTTFEGRVVCLPHHDMDSPHTLECAIGLQTDDGKYYGLKSDQSDSPISSAAGSDKRVRIEGTLKEEASTTYQSIGTITVTSFEFIQ